MPFFIKPKSHLLIGVFFLIFSTSLLAQVVPIGSGSYTLSFPGTDVAGRNTYPSGTPFVIGNAVGKPIPTNDWWSAQVKNAHADNLFNYPFTLKTVNNGLVVTYIPWGPIDNILPVVIGVTGLNAAQANISDFSDWTVSMDWANGGHHFNTTTGIGMPFLYFEKATNDVARIEVNQGNVTISNEVLIVEDARNGADFAIYAPTGSTWQTNGNVYTSTLNGKNYWSLGFIPANASNLLSEATAMQQYAYVFPTNTEVDWNYDETTGIVKTDFITTVDVKEGNDSTMLQGLLPHQWSKLASGAPTFQSIDYRTVRGDLKTIASNTFSVENKYYGILPTLPYVDNYSSGFSPTKLSGKVKFLENDALNPWTDSYNEGQEMNRLIQTARIAELTGDSVAFNKQLNTVKTRLEDWLEANANEVAFIFYYNTTWSAMIGYPAGHGQDGNINDHHFHWGYFIHAASFLEQYMPGWANQWGGMINLLVRDAATQDRNDNLFPFLRNFSPFAGHCWANGFASFPQGNDQESTSESMQFNSSLIHWGSVTGNDSIRDLGIYLYTTEQSAIEEYWFDMQKRNFSPTQQYSLVSRVWGNSYDNGTFWTGDIAASYGIELYPMHGGSFYLGQDTSYVRTIWNEITQHTGILNNDPNVNLWHDLMWKYLAFIDPEEAIALYDSYPDRNLKFGVSDAQTYHWLHAMNVLGNVDATITSDHPLAVVFNKNGTKTYVAQNYSNTSITVNYSDGFALQVPPKKLVTSIDVDVKGNLTSSFKEAYVGGSVDLTLNISNGTPTKVEFYSGEKLIGQTSQAPYTYKAIELSAGVHHFYAKIYDGTWFNISNPVMVTVGEQLPFGGVSAAIPGVIESGNYDFFEGGNGNNICYLDLTPGNNGDYRPNEFVDAETKAGEGKVIGWISPGEWLEYTVEVDTPGFYDVAIRYASGNNAGGGPLEIYSDGQKVKQGINFNYTGNWNTWSTKTVTNVPLKGGKQVLKFQFEGGELNFGKLTFAYNSPLTFSQPVANAGAPQVVILPTSTTTLDASQSTDPMGGTLTYQWKQIYGPTVLGISSPNSVTSSVSAIEEGVYLLELTTDNGNYTDKDQVYVIGSYSANVPPKVSIYNPSSGGVYSEGEEVNISVSASDLNDEVNEVAFFANNQLLFNDTTQPFEYLWAPSAGEYELKAIAKDGYNQTTTSNRVEVKVNQAPICEGISANGDFRFQFSSHENNPSITFIPNGAGIGSPTCLIYYGTDPGNMPGYPAAPNVPFQVNASKGERIYFYYVYSYPGLGQKDNSADKDNYLVGSCKGRLTSNFTSASLGGRVALEVTGTASNTTKVEFYRNEILIGQSNQKPYQANAINLPLGKQLINAKIYHGNSLKPSNTVEVLVGEQFPFFGEPFKIPGAINASQYDLFEAGLGQSIAYQRIKHENLGNYRKDELVSASQKANGTKTVFDVTEGEWLEFTTEVSQTGFYSLDVAYTNPSSNELGLTFKFPNMLKPDTVLVAQTNPNEWLKETISSIPLVKGKQTLRIGLLNDQISLRELEFRLNSPLNYNQPEANAGGNKYLVTPQGTTTLDGSNSVNPSGGSLNYLWQQIDGPTALHFSSASIAQPIVTGINPGAYRIKLTVDDGTQKDEDEIFLISSNSLSFDPTVKIMSPNNNDYYSEGDSVAIEAFAFDLNNDISRVDLYLNNIRVLSDANYPYVFNWLAIPGNYSFKTVAIDQAGNMTNSNTINLKVVEKVNCLQKGASGDFEYEFSTDKENPTIKFISVNSNIGDSICMIHYGVDSNNLKVKVLTPNQPFELSALWNSQIFYYFTYNKSANIFNTSSAMQSYLVGNCRMVSSVEELEKSFEFSISPNPTKDRVLITSSFENYKVKVLSIEGRLLATYFSNTKQLNLSLTSLSSGLYFIQLESGDLNATKKLMIVE